MSRYLNETKQTTLLPVKALQLTNTSKADLAVKVALSAQGKRTTSVFCVPAFFADNAAIISPLGKCNARGTVRSDVTLQLKLFCTFKGQS